MLIRVALAAACMLLTWTATAAQTDLDAFMARVLAERDRNWAKLQQYVLDERERLDLTGPGGVRLFGYHREYTWFPRDGVFIRSPLRADGVDIGEDERRREETLWLEREQRRARRQVARGGTRPEADSGADDPGDAVVSSAPSDVADVAGQLEPRFVSAAYFLRFRFDPGQYALAGRDTRNGREVLRIEYYPTRLFERRGRAEAERSERSRRIREQMNKASLVTLWIDRQAHQILEYTFENVDWDFMPNRMIIRTDEATASMRMGEPFPGVWLPEHIDMQFQMTTALGSIQARYAVDYEGYRLAEVTTRVR